MIPSDEKQEQSAEKGGEEGQDKKEVEVEKEAKVEQPSYTFDLLAGIRYPDMRTAYTVSPDEWACTRTLYQLRDVLFHTPDFSFLCALLKLKKKEYTLNDLHVGIQGVLGHYEGAEKYDELLRRVEEQIRLFGERYQSRYSYYRDAYWNSYSEKDALKPTALCIYALLLMPLGCTPLAAKWVDEAHMYNNESHLLDDLLHHTKQQLSLACYFATRYQEATSLPPLTTH